MTQGQLIGSYVHMQEKPREQHALFMLQKIASLVKPIMVQRGFKVGCLAEFWPTEKNLLGLNIDGGKKICIRLRQPYDDSVFLDLENCVYTMLHELTHNVYGPHDEKFHAFLKELEDEYIALRTSGYSGEGFYSEGKRLGVGRSHNPPSMVDARRKALAAAEKRRVLSTGSGQRLGGGKSSSVNPEYEEIRERVAAAALRRARISKTCGAESGTDDRGRMEEDAERAIRNGFRTQAEEEDANEAAILQAAIDLIEAGEREEEEMQRKIWEERGGYVWIKDDDEPVPAPASVRAAASTVQPTGSKHSRSKSSDSSPASESKRPMPANTQFSDLPPSYEEALGRNTWTCDLCTLINPISNSNCDACDLQKPQEEVAEIVEAPKLPPGPATQVARPGGLKRPTSVKKTERVRFGINPVTPAKRMWDCYHCMATNDIEWRACATCGLTKLRT